MRDEPRREELPPLRAADWRYLLPYPERGCFRKLVVLGGPAGLADRVAEIGIAEVVTRELPPGRSADAVAAFHDARVPYREIARCLLPGGALYCEIDRRLPRHLVSTPSRVRASLEAVGLSPTGAYVVGPSLYRPRVYVPLDAPAALAWYVRTLYNPWTPSVALIQAALRAVVGAGRDHVTPLVPHFAVTAVAGEERPRAPSVLGVPVLPPGLDGINLHPLLLTGTHHETLSQRAVILPFARDSTQPLAVVKVSKLPALNATLEQEQRVMADVRRRLDSNLRDTIPLPLGVGHWEDTTVATESYVPGESLQRASSRWGRPLRAKLDDLRLAAAWLAEFHHQTQVRRAPWSMAERAELVGEPLRAYRRAFGATESEERLFAEMQRYATRVEGTPLPIVLRKPDFFGSNVIRCGDEVSVVDWESPHLGPALCDLLRFVVPWSDVVSGGRGDRSYDNFRKLFLPERGTDAVSDAVHEAIARYLSRLSMDRRLFPVLLVYTWVDRALHHFEKQRLQGERPSDARAGNRHVDRVAVLADHTEQLFASAGTVPFGDSP
jgi:aminoglycoside phosphotransferase (APT) family kinase protein